MSQVKRIPTRTCTGCREGKAKKDLIRVVKDNEGNIFVDVTGKKNGRGAYICPQVSCLEKAMKSKGLERTLKTAIPADVYEHLRKEIGDINE